MSPLEESDRAWWAMVASLGDEEPFVVMAPTGPCRLQSPEEVFGMDIGSCGLFCPACKKQNVEYNLVATRSADEGMTAVCVCRECKTRFNMKV